MVATVDVNPEVVDSLGCTEFAGYDAEEVDAAIAELKRENERLVKCCKEYDSRQRIDERIKFNYAKQLRATKRALWMHRAITAKLNKEGCKVMREYNPFIGIEEFKWQEVERKCRAKAEEYK